jgi:uncharacterized protein (TIGR02757 family)
MEMNIRRNELQKKLNYHYRAFDKATIEPDPLQFPHLFNEEKDIEVMAFIASVFAYGNVKQIINSLNKFLFVCNNKPYDFIKNFSIKKSEPLFSFSHRFYTYNDINKLFHLLKLVYQEFDSLKNLFMNGYTDSDANVKNAITIFSNFFLERIEKESGEISNGVKFMFPLPEKRSACKRMNLFLRWMVRKDEIDFGIWNEIPTSKLIIPVDTHIARICKQLKLTKIKNVSWNMAEEITNNLKKFDPEDPVKYDFALCHVGMRKLYF